VTERDDTGPSLTDIVLSQDVTSTLALLAFSLAREEIPALVDDVRCYDDAGHASAVYRYKQPF
jgi:hypothetical protein